MSIDISAQQLYQPSVVGIHINSGLILVSDTVSIPGSSRSFRSGLVGGLQYWVIERCLELHAMGKPCSATHIVPAGLPNSIYGNCFPKASADLIDTRSS